MEQKPTGQAGRTRSGGTELNSSAPAPARLLGEQDLGALVLFLISLPSLRFLLGANTVEATVASRGRVSLLLDLTPPCLAEWLWAGHLPSPGISAGISPAASPYHPHSTYC